MNDSKLVKVRLWAEPSAENGCELVIDNLDAKTHHWAISAIYNSYFTQLKHRRQHRSRPVTLEQRLSELHWQLRWLGIAYRRSGGPERPCYWLWIPRQTDWRPRWIKYPLRLWLARMLSREPREDAELWDCYQALLGKAPPVRLVYNHEDDQEKLLITFSRRRVWMTSLRAYEASDELYVAYMDANEGGWTVRNPLNSGGDALSINRLLPIPFWSPAACRDGSTGESQYGKVSYFVPEAIDELDRSVRSISGAMLALEARVLENRQRWQALPPLTSWLPAERATASLEGHRRDYPLPWGVSRLWDP